MAPRFRCFAWVVALAAAVLLAAPGGQTRAQTLQEGSNELYKKFRAVKRRTDDFFRALEKVDPNDPAHVEAIDVLAKKYTYSVYLDNLDSEPNKIDRDYQDFARDLKRIRDSRDPQTMQPLAEVLSEKVGIHALEVLKFPQARPIHKLHNARLLAKTAELGQGTLAKPLLEALKDPAQNDGVRYYVVRGLGTLLKQSQPPDDEFAESKPALTKEQATQCAEAIVAFLEQKKGPAKNAPEEEIDGFRWLRREAVRALAQIRWPRTLDDKVRPALVLARFAGNDERIQPPPRIDERLTAAIGLARMKPGKDMLYQADYAASQIAKCLGALAQAVDDERSTPMGAGEAAHPWKHYATELKDALAALKKYNAKDMFVAKVVNRGGPLLDLVIKGVRIDANEQTWWTSSEIDPPSKELFKGASDSTVKSAPPGEAAPER